MQGPRLVLSDAQRSVLSGPLAVQVSAGSLGLLPEVSRGWGVELDAEGRLSFVLLDAQTERLRAAIAETRRVAVNATNPLTMESYQFKGDVIEIAEPDEAARQIADQRVAQFTEAISRAGFVQGTAAGVAHPGPARRIVLKVGEVFDQTPGPGAGRRLGAP
ncbi:MAG: hypothetical protein ABI627_17850 [Polyangiaceae bacterium]